MCWIKITSTEEALELIGRRMKYCNDKGEYFGCISRSFSVGELVYFKEEVPNGIANWIIPQTLYVEIARGEVDASQTSSIKKIVT